MAISSYTNGLKRLTQTLTPIAERYGKPKVVFWLDYFWSYIRYGITPNQYVGFRIYEKSGRERAEFYTHRQHKEFEKKLNDPAHYCRKKFKNSLMTIRRLWSSQHRRLQVMVSMCIREN